MEATARPKLRPLATHRPSANGQEGLLLSDPTGLFDGQVFVPSGLLPVVACFTGEQSLEEIARDLSLRFTTTVGVEDVRRIAMDLDARLCLEGAEVDRAIRGRRARWDALAARPAAHAGSPGYPSDAAQCALRLEDIVGKPDATSTRAVVGLIAPHIDLGRGEQGYRAAYRALLAAPPADLYVLFGTAHCSPREATLVPTRKHFDTPLGRVETDAAFVEEVATALGEDPWGDELLHVAEHSLEFQALLLKHCLGDRPFRIAPFLTGRLPEDPATCAATARLFAALHAAIERRARGGLRVTLIAGADLGHLGPYFGDVEPVSDELLSMLEQLDHASLERVRAHDSDGFYRDVEADDNPRRICGTAPIYFVSRLARELAPGCSAELLDYGQAVADDRSQVVTFASLAFRS